MANAWTAWLLAVVIGMQVLTLWNLSAEPNATAQATTPIQETASTPIPTVPGEIIFGCTKCPMGYFISVQDGGSNGAAMLIFGDDVPVFTQYGNLTISREWNQKPEAMLWLTVQSSLVLVVADPMDQWVSRDWTFNETSQRVDWVGTWPEHLLIVYRNGEPIKYAYSDNGAEVSIQG